MAITHFRFYEELNDFLPPARRKVTFEHPFQRRASVKDMIEALGVPHTEVELILVDGVSVGFDHIVRDGERIAVYPVFEAFDVSEHLKIRPSPLRLTRFVLDVHLGRLARYLRLAGFDCLYRNDYADAELARISADEHRILLTRDRLLLRRRVITHGYCLRSDQPAEQLVEVFNRFQLHDCARPFRRCARCNGELVDVPKAAVEHRLKPLTRRYYQHFRMCTSCERVYWRGSHVERIEALIGRFQHDGADGGAAGHR